MFNKSVNTQKGILRNFINAKKIFIFTVIVTVLLTFIFYCGTTGPGSPAVPSLLLPDNNAEDVSLDPLFSWTSGNNAEVYQIQVSTSSSFDTLFTDRSNIDSTSYRISGLSTNDTYSWRVNASNSDGTSDWSEIRMFTTIDVYSADVGVLQCNDTLFNNRKYGISFTYCNNLLNYLPKDICYSVSDSIYMYDLGKMEYYDKETPVKGIVDVYVLWPLLIPESAVEITSNMKSSLAGTDYSYISSDTSDVNGYTAGKIYFTYTTKNNIPMKSAWIIILSQSAEYQFFFNCQTEGFDKFESVVLNKFYSTINLSNEIELNKIIAGL